MGRTLIGLEMKLFRRTGGAVGDAINVAASANFSEVLRVKDLDISLTKAKASIPDRGANGWNKSRGTLKEGSITFKMNKQSDDTHLIAFQNAFLSGAPIHVVAADGAWATGTTYWSFECEVFDISESQPLQDGVTVNIVLEPTDGTINPSKGTL